MRKILIVDHDPKYMEAFRVGMESQDLQVIETNDFKAARELFDKQGDEFAAIILTASLGKWPPFDPYPFAKYIREAGFTGIVIGISHSQSHVHKMERHPHFTDGSRREFISAASRTLYFLQKSAA